MELVQISFKFVCTIIPISLHLFCCYVSIFPSVGAQHWWWERVRLDRWALDPIFSVLRGGWCVDRWSLDPIFSVLRGGWCVWVGGPYILCIEGWMVCGWRMSVGGWMGLHPVFANMQISSPVVKVHCMLTDQKVIFAHSGRDIDPLYMDFIQLKFKS